MIKSEIIHFLMAFLGMTTPVPEQCPSIKAIQAVPILVNKTKDIYYTEQISKFGTLDKWVFVVRMPQNDPEEILKASTLAVKTLRGSPIPVYESRTTSGEHWYCQYANAFGYDTYAVTLRSKVA